MGPHAGVVLADSGRVWSLLSRRLVSMDIWRVSSSRLGNQAGKVLTRKGSTMVYSILLFVLALGVIADIGITVLLHVKFHSQWEFLAWLGRRDIARIAWFVAFVVLVTRYVFGLN